MNSMLSHTSRRAERGGALVWILVTLIVLGGAFAVYWFVLRDAGGGASAAIVTRAIPAETKTVVGIDPQAVLKSDAFKSMAELGGLSMESVNAELAKANIKPEALKAVVLGMGADPSDSVMIFQGDLDPTALKAGLGAIAMASPEAAGLANAMQFEGVEGGLVIAGGGALYQASLAAAKGKGGAGLDAKLQAVMDAVDRGAPMWAAGVIPEESAAMLKQAGPLLGGSGPPSHGAISVDVGSSLAVKVALLFPGGDGSQIASTLGTMLGMVPLGQLPDGAGDLVKSIKFSGSGEVLKATVSIPVETLKKLGAGAL